MTGSWVLDGYTAWQEDPTPPSVASGHKLGEREAKTTGGTTETTGWLAESPGDGWVQTAERNVVDEDAWTETIPGEPSEWWNFEENKETGPLEGAPSYPTDPRGTWHHHGTLPPGQAGPDGVYRDGHGHGSWFYRKAATPEQTIQHPAVTHEEYQYARTTEGVTEYRWQILEWKTDGGSSDNGDGNGGGSGSGGTGGDSTSTPTKHGWSGGGSKSGAEDTSGTGSSQTGNGGASHVPKPVVPVKIDAGL